VHAVVGNQKKPDSSRESATPNGLVDGGSSEIPTGRVWCQAPGREAMIELIRILVRWVVKMIPIYCMS